MINRLNRPMSMGVQLPSHWVAGFTTRPIKRIELSFDIDTYSSSFGKDLGYQGVIRGELMQGFRLMTGYHADYKFQAGIQIDLGRTSIFSTGQPVSSMAQAGSQFTIGLQTSVFPRRSVIQPTTALRINIDSSLGEEAGKGGFFARDKTSLLEVLEAMKRAGEEDSVTTVIVKIERFTLGLASAEELHEAILALKKRGKTVEVFLGEAGTTEYLIASAATRIHMEPSGTLRLTGPRSERFYLKGTLDKLGIEPQLLAMGEYKSAPETFTRKEASPSSHKAVLHALDQIENEYIAALSKSRKISKDDYQKIIRHALFSPKDALEFRLIDAIDSFHNEWEKIQKNFQVGNSMEMYNDRLALPPRIAVIVASGDILKRKVRLLSMAGESQITPERMKRCFDLAINDPRTKAIVLRLAAR